MSKRRDTYKYYFKVGNKIVHGGITGDLERREEAVEDILRIQRSRADYRDAAEQSWYFLRQTVQ